MSIETPNNQEQTNNTAKDSIDNAETNLSQNVAIDSTNCDSVEANTTNETDLVQDDKEDKE